MSDATTAADDNSEPTRPPSLALGALDSGKKKEEKGNQADIQDGFKVPPTDFLPNVSAILDIVAEANAGGSEKTMDDFQESIVAQATELRKMFDEAKLFFGTNKYLQVSTEELHQLEQEKLQEHQRIKCVCE